MSKQGARRKERWEILGKITLAELGLTEELSGIYAEESIFTAADLVNQCIRQRALEEMSVETLEITDADKTALLRNGIYTIHQLSQLSVRELGMKIRKNQTFGPKAIERVQTALEKKGLPRLPEVIPRSKLN